MTDTLTLSEDRQVPDPAPEPSSERREFFRTAFGAGAVAMAGAAAIAVGSHAAAQTATTDTDLLNFLLNLEYLQAQFYSYAATGSSGLTAAQLTGLGTQGAVTGGRAVVFSDTLVSQYANEIAQAEVQHVAFLRAQLGTLAVAQPAIDIGSTATSAFSTAMRAAGIVGAGVAFDPYASDENFLLAAFFFADVMVTAYKGAAASLPTKTYYDAMAGLIAAESYHASIIRTVLYSKGADTARFRTQTTSISDARDLLDGAIEDDQGVAPVTLTTAASPAPAAGAYAPNAPALNGLSASNIVPTTADGLAYNRTTGAVLNIFYLNSLAVSRGGFFTAGVNGSINTSAAN